MKAQRKIIRDKMKKQEGADISGFWAFYQLGLNSPNNDNKEELIEKIKLKIKHMKKTKGSKKTIDMLNSYLIELKK